MMSLVSVLGCGIWFFLIEEQLYYLHHTRLEPPHRHPAGECTSQCCHCRHLPSLLRRLAKLSGDARPDGRQHACAQGDVARGLNPYPLHYRMAFASSILPFPHVYRLALRFAFPDGRRTGLPCSVPVTHGWVRRALSTGSVGCPGQGSEESLYPLQCPFGSSLPAPLACFL